MRRARGSQNKYRAGRSACRMPRSGKPAALMSAIHKFDCRIHQPVQNLKIRSSGTPKQRSIPIFSRCDTSSWPPLPAFVLRFPKMPLSALWQQICRPNNALNPACFAMCFYSSDPGQRPLRPARRPALDKQAAASHMKFRPENAAAGGFSIGKKPVCAAVRADRQSFSMTGLNAARIQIQAGNERHETMDAQNFTLLCAAH